MEYDPENWKCGTCGKGWSAILEVKSTCPKPHPKFSKPNIFKRLWLKWKYRKFKTVLREQVDPEIRRQFEDGYEIDNSEFFRI